MTQVVEVVFDSNVKRNMKHSPSFLSGRPVMKHDLLKSKQSILADARVFVSRLQHDHLLLIQPFDDTTREIVKDQFEWDTCLSFYFLPKGWNRQNSPIS